MNDLGDQAHPNASDRRVRINELSRPVEGINSRAFLDSFYEIVQHQFPYGAQLLNDFEAYCFDAIKGVYPDIKTVSHYFSLAQAGKVLGIPDSHEAVKTMKKLIKDRRIYTSPLSTPQLKAHGKDFEGGEAPRGVLVSMTGEQSEHVQADSLLMHRTLQQWIAQKNPSSDLRTSAMFLGDLTVLSAVEDPLALPTLWDTFIGAHDFPDGMKRHNWQDLARESKFTKLKTLVGHS